jgi:hypothetical protein
VNKPLPRQGKKQAAGKIDVSPAAVTSRLSAYGESLEEY